VSFDALTMHAVRDELEAALVGGFVEKVVALSELEVGLRVRSQHRDFNLLMSADAQAARIHLVGAGTLRRLSDDVSPFLLLMRKYVREGRIQSIQQPLLERVMILTIDTRQDDGTTIASELIIEVMGRHSNVILVGPDGKVLDAIKRVPPSMSRQRPVLPHFPYEPPPAVDKLNPRSYMLATQLAAAASQAEPAFAAWRFVQEALTGLGPLSAREVIYRVCGDASCAVSQVDSWQAVADALAALFGPLETHEWSPCMMVQGGDVIHYAPFPLTQFPPEQLESVDSISVAVERAYSERIQLRAGEALRAPLRASLGSKLERVHRREESLRQAMTRGEKAEVLKLTGQAILASVGQVEPGQKELRWDGHVIVLDPTLSPSENAQRYFKDYAKARDATKEVPALLEAARLEREYLEQLQALVEAAEDERDLRALSREIAETPTGVGLKPSTTGTRQPSKGRQKPGKGKPEKPAGTVKQFTSGDGHQILVGGSAKGNERVTFDLGTGGDLWLHARGIPGAHVILKMGGQEASRQELLEAARLAASHSQARESQKVPVDYTLQRYVKKIKGGPTGLVTYSQEKTVRVDATKGEEREAGRERRAAPPPVED
jgi:predicted ribosome quality control (RQC) complex YloA/Tae2 family protein